MLYIVDMAKRKKKPENPAHLKKLRAFRLSHQDDVLIEEAAEHAGISVSDWIRTTLLRALQGIRDADA